MANQIDAEEKEDAKDAFANRHHQMRVKAVKRYSCLKVKNHDTGQEKIVRRDHLFRGGRAELGRDDKYPSKQWEILSEHEAGADVLVDRDTMRPLDAITAEAYERNRREQEERDRQGRIELEKIREEMRQERKALEDARQGFAKDKAQIEELLGQAKGAKKKRAAAKKEVAPPTPPPAEDDPIPKAPPAGPVTEVQDIPKGAGARSI